MRILYKISGEMLSSTGQGVERNAMDEMVKALSEASKYAQVAVVVGGGNFWRGRDTLSLEIDRAKSDGIGMIATVMNAVALSQSLERVGVSTKIFSARAVDGVAPMFSLDEARNALEENKITFFCGGTGNPFFTTDSAAALRAIETHCDLVAKATTVDGVYTANPKEDPTATKYDEVSFDEVISKNLQVMDTAAFALCRENNLPIRVFDGRNIQNIIDIAKGENIGTLVA